MTNVKNTEVAVATIAAPINKAGVPAVLEQLKAQLKALKGDVKNTISLDINYSTGLGGSSINIKSVTKVSDLLTISSAIQARNAAYNEEVVRFDLVGKIEAFKVSEKTAEEWVAIITKAISELLNKTQISKLEDAISKLSKYEDEETRLARELAEIVGNANSLIQ